jgi:hypothetical protein
VEASGRGACVSKFAGAVTLDYAEAQDDYVALASEGRKPKQQTIASLEACLDPERFVRVHRSYIVNFERVVRIEPYGKDSRLAILADGTRLPVSRAGYARLKTLLANERRTANVSLGTQLAHPDAFGGRLPQMHRSPVRTHRQRLVVLALENLDLGARAQPFLFEEF